MVKPTFASVALPACCLLLSCAAPKAIVVAETDKPAPQESAAAAPDVPAPTPGPPDDGIRLPDMLGLPGEGEFRSVGVAPGRSPGSGTVIARPPVPPPPKPEP